MGQAKTAPTPPAILDEGRRLGGGREDKSADRHGHPMQNRSDEKVSAESEKDEKPRVMKMRRRSPSKWSVMGRGASADSVKPAAFEAIDQRE